MPGGGGGTKRRGAAAVIYLSVLYTDRYMSMTHSSRSKTLNAYAKRFQKLKSDLAQIEYFSKGTLLVRMVRCGKPQCACGKDPAKRHGPYYEWTYKARGKPAPCDWPPKQPPSSGPLPDRTANSKRS